MNDQQDESLAMATREIISVSEELTRLRGAVQQHSAVAGGLNELSGALSDLSRVLQKLPDPIASVAAKGEQLVGKIEQALGPAGKLLSAVNQLSDSIAELPSEAMLRERFDVIQEKIDDSSRESARALVRMDEKVTGIAESLTKLAGLAEKQVTDTASGFSMIARELTLATKARATGLAQLQDKVAANGKRMDELFVSAQNHAGESARKLDVLDRLARRSLFAILTGRDGEKKQA